MSTEKGDGRSMLMPVIFDGYSPRKDGSIGLRFISQEMSPLEVSNIHGSLHSFGVLYFKGGKEGLEANELAALQNMDTDLYDKRQKSQSQRLRGVLHVLWSQDPNGGEWPEYYRRKTEAIIEHLKNKIDP